jgi:hypothetical protein
VPSETRDGRNELVGFDWLRHMHLITRRKCAVAIVRPRVGRQRQRGDMMWTAIFTRPDLPDEGIPILVRQPDIRDDHWRRALLAQVIAVS